jgi:hypothetical protein
MILKDNGLYPIYDHLLGNASVNTAVKPEAEVQLLGSKSLNTNSRGNGKQWITEESSEMVTYIRAARKL